MSSIHFHQSLSITMIGLQTPYSIENIVIISKKGLLVEGALRKVSIQDLAHDMLKIQYYVQQGRIAFVDDNDKLHVAKGLCNGLHGKVEKIAYQSGEVASLEIEEMDEEEFVNFQLEILKKIASLGGIKKKNDSDKIISNTAKALSQQAFSTLDPQIIEYHFQHQISEIIRSVCETFAESRKKEEIRREEEWRTTVIKEVDKKKRLLAWDLKQYDLKLVFSESTRLVHEVRQDKRDWHPLHPNNQFGNTEIAAF